MVTQEQIIEAIKNEPTLVAGILPTIQESEAVKTLIDNKATSIYNDKIGDEVKNIHSRYDEDAFGIIGERPEAGEDGNKVKTYDFIKAKLVELKDLRSQKASLSVDARVVELEGQIEKLKTEGGAKHVQEVFDQAKETWNTEKSRLSTMLEKAQEDKVNFQKKTQIGSALSTIKFDPSTPDSVKRMVLGNAEAELMKNSKIEEGKLVFLDANGKPSVDPTSYAPRTAVQMLEGIEAIKDISLQEDKGKGGGANPSINGSIITSSVEGKNTKTLNLPAGSFKTRVEFQAVVEKTLLESGVTRRDADWTKLSDEAYNRLNVKDLPLQ